MLELYSIRILWKALPFFGLLFSILASSAHAQAPHILMNQQFYVDGVNCHGISLLSARLVDDFTYVGREEMEGILSQFCQGLNSPQPGSIGYLAGDSMVNHSFFVLDYRKMFQKRSADASSKLKVIEGELPKNARYYLCQVPPVESDCSNEAHQFILKVNEYSKYYAGLLTLLRDSQKRDAIFIEMKSLSVPTRSNSCPVSLFRSKLRLKSLLDLAYELDGLGFIRHQKYSPMKQRGS